MTAFGRGYALALCSCKRTLPNWIEHERLQSGDASELVQPANCGHTASPDSRRLNDRCIRRAAGRSVRTTRPITAVGPVRLLREVSANLQTLLRNLWRRITSYSIRVSATYFWQASDLNSGSRGCVTALAPMAGNSSDGGYSIRCWRSQANISIIPNVI